MAEENQPAAPQVQNPVPQTPMQPIVIAGKKFNPMFLIGGGVLLLIIVAGVVGLIVANANKKTEVKVGDNTVSVDNKGNVSVKSNDGSTYDYNTSGSGGSTTLPKNFPSDFPTLSGGIIVNSGSISSSGKTTWTVEYSVSGSVDNVYNGYSSKLKTNGWTVDEMTGTSDGKAYAYLSGEKGERGYYMTIEDSSTSGKVSVAIVLSDK